MPETPLIPDVVEVSRKMGDGEFLDPGKHWPALFSCVYRGYPATGLVAPNGIVSIVPHTLGPSPDSRFHVMPTISRSFREIDRLERDGEITDLTWEWQVTRRCEPEVYEVPPPPPSTTTPTA